MTSTSSLADRFSQFPLLEDGAERSLAADFFQVHIFQDAALEGVLLLQGSRKFYHTTGNLGDDRGGFTVE